VVADWITQVVTSQGDEVFFKIKRNTKLTKLRSAYANKVGKDLNSIRYVLYLTSLVAFGRTFGSADVVSHSVTLIHSLLHRILSFDEASLTNM